MVERFPLVGIGASAGGLEALQEFVQAIPNDSGLAYVIVQHLAPDHPSIMDKLLNAHASISVLPIEDGVEIEKDTVYVIPPGSFLEIEDGRFRLIAHAREEGVRTPIDKFFASLANAAGRSAFGVILSGTGSDGTLGVRAIKSAGGVTLVQDSGSARFPGMPDSAAATGLVDFALRPKEMPDRILDILSYRERLESGEREVELKDEVEARLDEILSILDPDRENFFTDYKPATLVRRIQRRLSLLRQSSVDGYLDRLGEDAEERETLMRDFLIGVTEFFRDPETYEIARKKAVAKLVASDVESLRLWVPGCSTGEEAYSLAILFAEEMERQNRKLPLQVFGTDVDMHALRHSRIATYAPSTLSNVSEARLNGYFQKENGSYKVVSRLREMCVFAPHNLLRDPPFSRLDMISCRNVMIYLTGDGQRTVLPRFHYGLKPGGYLLLGSSETLGRNEDLFDEVDRASRLFRRNDATRSRFTALDGRTTPRHGAGTARKSDLKVGLPLDDSQPESLEARAERLFLQTEAAPFALINGRSRIDYLSEGMTQFVRPASGSPELTVDSFLSRELRLPVHAALSETRETGARAEVQNVVAPIDGTPRLFDVVATPLADNRDMTLIVLREVRQREGSDITPGADQAASAEVVQRELTLANRRLEAMEREYADANQESQSANEELLSMNEELQSANEELETSREELQSINEELETINAELSENNRQLGRANSDLKNILESTNIATLFLDSSLRVRLFTPAVSELYGVRERDLGRDIADLAARVDYPQLAEDAAEVMETLRTLDREVRVPATRQVFQVQLRPYRTVDDRLDGTVITFFDVTTLKSNEEQLEENARVLREQYAELETIYDSTPVGLSLMDKELRWLRINPELAAMNGFPVEDHIGKKLEDLIPSIKDPVRQSILKVLETGEPILGIEVTGETPKEPGVEREWVVDYYPIKDGDETFAVGTCVQEITETRRLERKARKAAADAEESRAQLRRLFDSTPAFVAMHEGPEHRYIYSNPQHDKVAGERELVGLTLEEAFPELAGTEVTKAFDEVYRTGTPLNRPEFKATLRDPQTDEPVMRRYSQVLQPWFQDDGSVGGVMSFAFDVTEQVEARAALEESEARMGRLFDQAPAIISIFEGEDHRYVYVNPKHDEAVGRTDLIGKTMREAMPELEGQGIFERFEQVYRTGKPYVTDELPAQVEGPDGRTTYYQQIIQPWFDEDGNVGGTMSFNTEITELVEAREERQAALNRLTSIQDSLVSFVGLLSLDGTLMEANARAIQASGQKREDLVGKKFWDCYWWNHSAQMQKNLQDMVARAAKGENIRTECDIRVNEGGNERLITIDFQIVPSFDDAGKVTELVPSGIDVTAWREAEERKDTLLAELQHRVKNVLATVQAITRFTARTTEDKGDFVDALGKRLSAISRTHDSLTRTDWGGQSLHRIIKSEVAPYMNAEQDRLTIDGEDVDIAPHPALSLSLALHELATNAAKYGALSTAAGRVCIKIQHDADTPLTIEWREIGGPTVKEPSRHGFGSFLLERILPRDLDATVDLDYAEDGVRCRIELDTNSGVFSHDYGE